MADRDDPRDKPKSAFPSSDAFPLPPEGDDATRPRAAAGDDPLAEPPASKPAGGRKTSKGTPFPIPADDGAEAKSSADRPVTPAPSAPSQEQAAPELVAAAKSILGGMGKAFRRDKTTAAPQAADPEQEPFASGSALGTEPLARSAGDDPAARRTRSDERGSDDPFGKTSPTMDKGPVQTRKTLVIAGKEHAVGLRWRILNDPGNARAEAAEAAMDGENLFVSTSAGTPAIGLGNTASGHAAGMPSLAGRLAAAVNGNWSGLFSLDGAYYVVAVRGGIVDDRSDVVFIDKADALKAFVDVASGGAGRILVTADLVGDLTTFPSVEAFEPLTFLTGALKPALEDIEQRFTLPVRQIAIGAVAAVLAAIFLFNPAGLYDRVKTAVGLGPKVEKQVIVIPPAPWAGQPKAPAMIRACTAGFALVPSWIRAWKVDRVECDGRTLTIAVSRAGTLDASAPPVTWLDDWVRNSGTLASDLIKLDRPTLNRSQQGNITIVWRLPAYRPQDRWREADSPEPMAEEQRRLWLEMERRYVPVNIAAGQATQYFGSTQINVVFDIFQTERVVAAMDRRVQVASRLTFDVASRRVTAGTRIFARLQPFPSGDNVEVLRQPSLAQVEGPNLPAPPP